MEIDNHKYSSPTVSVVMSVYNGEKYLREAIDSVLNQSFNNFELIIINDGSTDQSLSIIHSYSDARIVLLDNEINKGLIYSLNRGLQQAKGSYIARMDADDICLPDRLKLQLDYFKLNPETVITGSDYFLLNEGRETYIRNINDSDYQKAVLLFSPGFCHPTVMMKNIFKEQNVFYNKNFVHAEDYKLWTDLVPHGEFANVCKPLLKYRHHASQVSNQKNESQLAISREIRKSYCEQLKFNLTDAQFEVLNRIGNNDFIRTFDLLNQIENLLIELGQQNEKLQNFNIKSFKRFMFKFWLDSCGNTNLGLRAYRRFFNSEISSYQSLPFSEKNIFLAKCLIRKFRN